MEIKRTYILASLLVFFSLNLSAQNDPGNPIVLTATGNREVPKASRIEESPLIQDTAKPTAVIDYPALNLFFPTEIELDKIEAASVVLRDKLPQLYNSYLKLGVGSKFMPLGEFYFNNTRSRKYHYGVHLKHLSSFGNIADYAPAGFDRTRGEIFGSIIQKRYQVNGDFHYGSQGLHYYGFKNDTIDKDSIRQRYNDVGFHFDFLRERKDTTNLNFKVGLTYNNFTSRKPDADSLVNWRARENFFAIDGGAWYKMGKEVYSVDIGINYNGYRFGEEQKAISPADTGLFRNNTIFSLTPRIATYAFNNRLKASVGVNLSIDGANDKTKAYIYPLAEAKYSLFNDIFIPYVGIRGGLTQQSFRRLAQQNEFILPNIEIRNEHKAIELYGGFKGTISKQIGFNFGAGFAHIKNFALFYTDTLHIRDNQFFVGYDTMNVAKVEGSIFFQIQEKLKIDLIGRYNSYTLLNNSYAWYMPTAEFVIRGKYNLFEKLVAQVDVNLQGGRRALVYEDGVNVKLENGQYVLALGFLADANVGLEYIYNNRISAFFQMNNVAAQRYLRWNNYPVMGFQAMGGFTFKF